VPKRQAPSLWWTVFFWPGSLGKREVPEALSSKGMCCPECRTIQPFFELCPNCGCNFACFVVVEPDGAGQSASTESSGFGRRPGNGLFAPLAAFLSRFGRMPLRVRVMTACLALLLLISAVAGVVRYRSDHHGTYAHRYVLVLYLIKSGINLGEKACDGTYKEWREGVASAAPTYFTEIDSQAVADLKAVKAKIDGIMAEMGDHTDEYEQAAGSLARIYALYEIMNSTILTSRDSVSQHTAELAAAREEFDREIRNLKANMPLPLAQEVKTAGQKYDLRFMEAAL